MRHIPRFLLLCVLTARCSPTRQTIISKAHENCYSLQDKLFCDFKDTGIHDVYLEPLDFGANINKVYIHNAENLHVAGSFCTNVAFQNVVSVIFEEGENESCKNGFELAARGIHLERIPKLVTKIYLEMSKIKTLSTDTKLGKLTLLNSDVDVLRIASPFGNNSGLVLQGSRIGTLEKLILETDVEAIVNNVNITSTASEGLVVNHGNFTFKDTSFVGVLSDSIILHEDSMIYLESLYDSIILNENSTVYIESFPGNIRILKPRVTALNEESGYSTIYIVIAICLCVVVALLIICAVVYNKVFRKKYNETNAEDQTDGEAHKMASNIPEVSPLMGKNEQEATIQDNGNNSEMDDSNEGLETKNDEEMFKDKNKFISEQTMTIEEMHAFLENVKSKNLAEMGTPILLEEKIRIQKTGQHGQSDYVVIETEEDFRNFLEVVGLQISNENKVILPENSDSFKPATVTENKREMSIEEMKDLLLKLLKENSERFTSIRQKGNTIYFQLISTSGIKEDQEIKSEEDFKQILSKAKLIISKKVLKKFKFIVSREIYDILEKNTVKHSKEPYFTELEHLLSKLQIENKDKILEVRKVKDTVHVDSCISKGNNSTYEVKTVSDLIDFITTADIFISVNNLNELANNVPTKLYNMMKLHCILDCLRITQETNPESIQEKTIMSGAVCVSTSDGTYHYLHTVYEMEMFFRGSGLYQPNTLK